MRTRVGGYPGSTTPKPGAPPFLAITAQELKGKAGDPREQRVRWKIWGVKGRSSPVQRPQLPTLSKELDDQAPSDHGSKNPDGAEKLETRTKCQGCSTLNQKGAKG